MKIIHVFHSYYPVLGGLERVVQRIAEEQANLRNDVHVITSTYRSDEGPKREVLNNVHVLRVKALRLQYPDLTIPREIPYELLKRADVVHAYSQNSIFNYVICQKAKTMNKIIATYFLGIDYLRHHHDLVIRLLGYSYQRAITKKFVQFTSIPLTTNEYESLLMKKLYGIDTYVVPHGVDQEFLETPPLDREFLNNYNLEGRIITYLGRIDFMKGIDLLIHAFALVLKEYPDTTLVIAGKGDTTYLRKCLELSKKLNIQKKVKYIGPVYGKNKIGLIDASTVIVTPTRATSESYPLIMDEAYARGKPIIFSDASKPVAYKTVEEKRGFVFSKNDYRQLAKIIKLLLDGKIEFEVKKRPLTWKEVALRLLELYSKAS